MIASYVAVVVLFFALFGALGGTVMMIRMCWKEREMIGLYCFSILCGCVFGLLALLVTVCIENGVA